MNQQVNQFAKWGVKFSKDAEVVFLNSRPNLNETPYEDRYTSSLGSSGMYSRWEVLIKNGSKILLTCQSRQKDACNHIPDREYSAPPIYKQLADENIEPNDIEFMVNTYRDWDDFRGGMETFKITVYSWNPLDIEKIRRRVRDELNKTQNTGLILKAAYVLSVKIE